MFKNLFVSEFISRKSAGGKIAYIGAFTALSVIAQAFVEFKLFIDVQFSLTIFVSMLCGIVLGGGLGFVAAFLGDLLGWLINSGGMYMFWVGLSTAVVALIAGAIFSFVKRGGAAFPYLKLAVSCLATFLICTVLINSLGFYLYNRAMGFSKAVMAYVDDNFGGNVSFFAYLAYRLIFKGQILNNVFNYALLFAILPGFLRSFLKDAFR